jgi:hypothetical protein
MPSTTTNESSRLVGGSLSLPQPSNDSYTTAAQDQQSHQHRPTNVPLPTPFKLILRRNLLSCPLLRSLEVRG